MTDITTRKAFYDIVSSTTLDSIEQFNELFDRCTDDVLREVQTNPFAVRSVRGNGRKALPKTLISVSAEMTLALR